MYYNFDRGIWMVPIKKARKDNPAVRAGEPYIRVKRDKYGIVEYFKDEEALDEVYPKPSFKDKHSSDIKMLKAYKKALKDSPNMGAERFLKMYYNYE